MSKRDFRLYLDDILESSAAIEEFVVGLSMDEFTRDRKTSSAVIREFEIIGEAVGKLPQNIRSLQPGVQWQDIKDFRNLLIHEYFGVDLELVWNVVRDDLPILHNAVKKIIERMKDTRL